MPKDPTKNIFQYKIRGGHLNEFEFQQNQGQVKEQHERPWERENFDPNTVLPGQEEAGSPKAQAKLSRSGVTTAKQTVKASEKGSKKAAKKQAAKKPAKSASRKTTSKSAKKKVTSKKATTRKAVSTNRAKTTRKSAAKKSTSRKARTTRGAKKALTTRRSAKK